MTNVDFRMYQWQSQLEEKKKRKSKLEVIFVELVKRYRLTVQVFLGGPKIRRYR